MSLVIVMANMKAKPNALLPTFEVELMAKHQEGSDAFFGSAICHVYLGEDVNYSNLPIIATIPIAINQSVKPNDHVRFTFDVVFTPEQVYTIKRHSVEGRTISFVLRPVITVFYHEKILQDTKGLMRGSFASDARQISISYEEWAKAVTNKSDFVFVPVSHETYEKLQTLLPRYRPMKSLGDLVDELANQNIERGKSQNTTA